MTPDEIKQLREQLGFTQTAFAQVLRVSVYTVSLWERGGRQPNADSLTALRRLQAQTTHEPPTDYDRSRIIDWQGARYIQLTSIRLSERPQYVELVPCPENIWTSPSGYAATSMGEGPYALVWTLAGRDASIAIETWQITTKPEPIDIDRFTELVGG